MGEDRDRLYRKIERRKGVDVDVGSVDAVVVVLRMEEKPMTF